MAEVVRCRNCINFDPDWGGADWGFCYEVMKQPVDVDFFCAAGERKEGEGMTKVYEEMCVGCWRESLCHEDMQLCDAYEAAMDAYLEEKKDE